MQGMWDYLLYSVSKSEIMACIYLHDQIICYLRPSVCPPRDVQQHSPALMALPVGSSVATRRHATPQVRYLDRTGRWQVPGRYIWPVVTPLSPMIIELLIYPLRYSFTVITINKCLCRQWGCWSTSYEFNFPVFIVFTTAGRQHHTIKRKTKEKQVHGRTDERTSELTNKRKIVLLRENKRTSTSEHHEVLFSVIFKHYE